MEGEELETVQSIFSEEVSVCEGDEGSKLVEYRSKGDLVLTVQLTGTYPDTTPVLVLADHLNTVGLREHLQDSIKDLVGSPMLFQLFSAAREWIESHPFSVNATPTILTQEKLPEVSSKSICKFFAKGNCKFGSDCKNYHPGSQRSPPKQLCSEAKSVRGPDSASTAKDLGTQSSHSAKDCNVHLPTVAKENDVQRSSMESETKKQPMRTASDVISRILWDPDINTEEFTVGYLDRFVGVIEKPFTAFSWEDLASVGVNVLAVPKHRIQYFKYRQEVVWDKTVQLDNVFGSRGGKLIQEVVEAAGSEKSGEASKASGASQVDSKVEGAVASKSKAQEDRPTHFICIHVTSEEVRTNVQRIQDSVVGHSPHLAEGCLPLTALHVSVCMVRLETDSQLETAKTVLENTKKHLAQFLPRCAELIFSGVDHFHNRLLYAKVLPDAGLSKFSSFLIERFRKAGLKTPGNHVVFTPHMTLVKMSRPMQHAIHTNMIDHGAYSQFRDTNIGKQRIGGIYLCSMLGPKQDDGFYKWFHFSSNSMLNLSPLLPSVLAKFIGELRMRGALSETQNAELSKASNSSLDVAKFDQSIRAVKELLHNSSDCGSTRVVILRGLPGSGKSHLSRCCSEANIFAVVSADAFFSKFGRYEFVQHLLPEAHSRCLEDFVQAVLDGTEVIVVDNTNSTLWEYRNYVSLCETFGIRYHILEIPHPNQRIVAMYCARNLHRVDQASIKSFTERWEEEKKAMLVPPNLAYPRVEQSNEAFGELSLLSLCQPGYLPKKLVDSSSALLPVYTGIFLTPKSQWKLVTALPPTHPRIYADHVTLIFEPSLDAIASTDIGKKVTVIVKGLADSSTVQAAAVGLPNSISSQNKHPHITISTDETTAPKFANDLLESQPATPVADQIKLNGMVGIVVKEESVPNAVFHTILSRKHFNNAVLPRLSTDYVSGDTPTVLENPSLTPTDLSAESDGKTEDTLPLFSDRPRNDVSICTGFPTVTELYVFDFDGTLFDTPDPGTGRLYYEKCTGQRWPHRGWLSSPASLLPPMKVKPGPALADYRRHCGRAGSVTVVLTARITRTEAAVRTVLEDHQLSAEPLILKPSESQQETPDYKVESFANLLKQFPDVTVVKFWDDRVDNLEAVKRFSKRQQNSRIIFEIRNPTTVPEVQPTSINSSTLGSYLDTCGLLPTEEHMAAAQTGIHFIAAQFCAIVGFEGDPCAITLVFGSHALGRTGDVDICLLAPPGLSHTDCIEKLAQQLEKCGVTHLHKGYSTRCPRLKVLLQFKDTPSIDFDIVFAIVSSSEAFSARGKSSAAALTHSDVEKLLSSSDIVSQTAVSGYTLLCKVQEAIRGFIPSNVFGAVVEMTVQVLRAQREKANYYHYIRTFHIVLLLADFVKRNIHTVNPQCDYLFEQFIVGTSQHSPQDWQRVFQEYIQVSPEYVPQFSSVFKKLSTIIKPKDVPLATRYEDMLMRPAFPPSGYTPVWLVYSGGDHVIKWRLQTLLDAKLPTFIQHLLSSGLDVVLDGNGVHNSFCFAVQETESTQKTVQLVFRKFWNEFSEYRNQKDFTLELKFSRTLEPTSWSNDISKEVERFAASSEQTELHLPASLSSYDRLLTHETAERLGISHTTINVHGKKHVFLQK